MAILRFPNRNTIQVPENATAREVIEQLRRQGMSAPTIYDPNERRPLAPDERVGNRELVIIDRSSVGGTKL